MPELIDLQKTFINYNNINYVTIWLNVSNVETTIYNIYCNKEVILKCEIANDENYVIVKTIEKIILANTYDNICINTPSRYIRFVISGYTPPINIVTQCFIYENFNNSSITNNKNEYEISNLPLAAFGEMLTSEEVPKIQYIFNRGTSGNILAKTYKIPFSDIKTYTNTAASTLNISDGKYYITGQPAGNISYMYGSPYKYRAGQGLITKFTAFFKQGAKNISGINCTLQYAGVGNLGTVNDIKNFLGFGYGDSDIVYENNSFGIIYINDGIKQFINISDWNGDKITIINNDWTKINIFKITVQYLGGGNIRFYVMDNDTSNYKLVHTLKLAGTLDKSNLSDPSVGLIYYQYPEVGKSTPSLNNDEVGGCSFFLGIEGGILAPYERFGSSNIRSILANVETPIISIKNNNLFYGLKNNVTIDIDFLTLSVDGTKSTIINIYKNCVLSGANFITPYTDNIPISIDKVGNLTTAGILLYCIVLGKVDTAQIDLTELHTRLLVDDVITITAISTGASEVVCGLSYHIS